MEVWSVLGSSGGCLLRFHPFIGLKAIAATNRHVVLLSKFSNVENVSLAAYVSKSSSSNMAILSDIRHVDKLSGNKGSLMPLFSGNRRMARQQPVEKITFSYNVYILNFVELCEIVEDMLEKAIDAEMIEPEKHLKLIKESHSLLQSKYYELLSQESIVSQQDKLDKMRLQVELFNYTNLLKRSFGLLGDIFSRLSNSDQAAQAYAHSDRSLLYVMQRLESRTSSLIQYLENVLFDPTKASIAHQNLEVGNRILDLYAKYAPYKLSTVILESNLVSYSQPLAIQFLEDIAKSEESGWQQVRPKDAFALGLLLLDTNMVEKATQVFASIEPHCIVEFAMENPSLFLPNKQPQQSTNKPSKRSLLFDDDEEEQNGSTHNQPSQQVMRHVALARMLLSKFPWCLLEILVRLRDKIPMEDALTMLTFDHHSTNPSSTDILNLSNSKHNILQQIYLSCLLTSTSRDHHPSVEKQQQAIDWLLDSWLQDLSTPPVSTTEPESTSVLSESLTECRSWCTFMNMSFLPYRQAWLNDFVMKPLMLTDGGEQVEIDLNQMQSSDALFVALVHPPLSPVRQRFNLYSAQGILCCEEYQQLINREQLLTKIDSLPEFEGKFSLRVLCLASSDSALNLLLKDAPTVYYSFAKQYCGHELNKWKYSLDKVLSQQQTRPHDVQVLEQLLWHMASHFSPGQFLSVLPKNGSMLFFMPFLSHCYSVQCANQARQDLIYGNQDAMNS
jgi:hypothetical protein